MKFDLKAGNGETILTSEIYVEDQTKEGYAEEKHPKFEIYQDKGGEFRFRLKATNGQIIGVSEGYTALIGCKNGVESVKKNTPDAEIVRRKSFI